MVLWISWLAMAILLCMIAFFCAPRHERNYTITSTLTAWFLYSGTVYLLSDIFPFAGGGDDEEYFFAATAVTSLPKVFDLSRYASFAQPGYPILLSLISYLSDQELVLFKWVNVSLFILIALTWYKIGQFLEGEPFGRNLLFGILFFCPLAYYGFFVLKDMAVSFLLSLGLLSSIWFRSGKVLAPGLLLGVSIGCLLFFRIPLILQVLACVLLPLVWRLEGVNRGKRKRVVTLVLMLLLSVSIFFSLMNPALVSGLGISQRHNLSPDNLMERAVAKQEGAHLTGLFFVIMYLVIDAAAINPESWSHPDPSWLRGFSAFPWIGLCLPFFMVGFLRLLQGLPRTSLAGTPDRVLSSTGMRLSSTAWNPVIVFLVISFLLSYSAGDTTRWRSPDLPAMMAIAVLGWYTATPDSRARLLVYWCWTVVTVAAALGLWKSLK